MRPPDSLRRRATTERRWAISPRHSGSRRARCTRTSRGRRTSLRDDARGCSRLSRGPRRDSRASAGDREDQARAAEPPPCGRRPARRGDGLRPGVEVPRGRAARARSSRSAAATRSASASCSARGASRASSAPIWTKRRRAPLPLGGQLGLHLAEAGGRHRCPRRPAVRALGRRHARLFDASLSAALIVNPQASGVTPELILAVERQLAPVETILTERVLHAVEIAEAVSKEHDRITSSPATAATTRSSTGSPATCLSALCRAGARASSLARSACRAIPSLPLGC